MQGTWKFTANTNKTYDVKLSWTPVSDCRGYSVALQKEAGGNPGPLVDTYASNITFSNIREGKYSANIKCQVNGSWTSVRYWDITVPAWQAPVLTPSPAPTIVPRTQTPDSSGEKLYDTTFQVLFGIGIFLILGYLGVIFSLHVFRWIIEFIKNNDWIWGVLFWGFLLFVPFLWNLLFEDSSSPSSSASHSRYSCNCSKTCSNLSCSEAYFQLNECGCSARDGDGDGLPCEAQCR